MAINIEDFRKSLRVDLSRDLVQKILAKYENFDFSNASTNNGSKLSVIDSINTENINNVDYKPITDYFDKKIREEYLTNRGVKDRLYLSSQETLKNLANDVLKVMDQNLFSRPNSITVTSKLLLDKPQSGDAIHLLTINTNSSDIFSIAKSLINDFSKYGIPFDIEFPGVMNLAEGQTEAIKLHVTTNDLEDTIKGIARISESYKGKFKKPNMFNINVKDMIGYDSLIDAEGTRVSDLLGTAIIKALDTTIVELAKENTFDGLSVVDYLKNAENKDLARQRVIKTVKEKFPNITDPVLQNTIQVIKNENIEVDIENIYTSSKAQDELNNKYGVLEDFVINVNEVEQVKEDKFAPVKETINDLANSFKAGLDTVKNSAYDNIVQAADILDRNEQDLTAMGSNLFRG